MRNERNHNKVKSAYSEFAVSTRRARTSWWSIIRDFRRRMIRKRKGEETSVFIDRGGCKAKGMAVAVEHPAPIFTSVCPAPVDVSSLRRTERDCLHALRRLCTLLRCQCLCIIYAVRQPGKAALSFEDVFLHRINDVLAC